MSKGIDVNFKKKDKVVDKETDGWCIDHTGYDYIPPFLHVQADFDYVAIHMPKEDKSKIRAFLGKVTADLNGDWILTGIHLSDQKSLKKEIEDAVKKVVMKYQDKANGKTKKGKKK